MAECTIQDLREDYGCPANTTLKEIHWAQLQMLCSMNDWLSGASINPCDVDSLIEEGRCSTASAVELEYWSALKFCEMVTALSAGGIGGVVLPVPNGGSGAVSLTGILQGNGAAAFTALTGTANYLPKWSATAPYLTATSKIYDNGTNVGINTTTPLKTLEVAGSARVTGTASSTITGTADPTASTTLVGTGTLFLSELVVGDRITVNGETRTVLTIPSDISLTVDAAFTNTAPATITRLSAILLARLSSGSSSLALNDIGNFGVGTANPAVRLHVYGSFPFMMFEDQSTPSFLAFRADTRMFFDSALTLTINSQPYASRGTASGETVRMSVVGSNGNIGFNTSTFGTSAAKVLALGNGTAPTTSPADVVQMWSADRGGTAGKASLHLRTEDGTQHVFGDLCGIGTLTPGASAKLQIDSTTSGFLPPRMTKAQRDAIGTPANGLMLYQTDGTAGVKAYVGGAWVTLNTTADP